MLRNPQMLEAAVLVLLKRHPSHGYALFGAVQELGVDIQELTALYRVLRKLEGEGVVTSRWDPSDSGRGPARKIYAITRFGQRHLRQQIQILQANADAMQRIEAEYLELAGEAG